MKKLLSLRALPEFTKRGFPTEKEHEYRVKFARDRDRILYSTEFRRLDRKTQVFVSSFDDNSRNRLTHTIEVAQIAKTISEYFMLDLDLTEAIAFGHDIGHTPFGHTGERTLNLILNGCDSISYFDKANTKEKGFKHNWQSLRVVTKLEKISDLYDGLNLTDFTLWGLLHHTNMFYGHDDDLLGDENNSFVSSNCSFCSQGYRCTYLHKNHSCEYDGKHHIDFYSTLSTSIRETSWTIEALIVRIADEIAQRHHDIEDGIYARIIDNKELVDLFYNEFREILSPSEKRKLTELKNKPHNNLFIIDISDFIVNFYVNQLIKSSKSNIGKMIKLFSVKDNKDFHCKKNEIAKAYKLLGLLNIISFDPEFKKCDSTIKKYLKHRILNSHLTQTMDNKSSQIIRRINYAYLSNPSQLPDKTVTTIFKNLLSEQEYKRDTMNKSPLTIAGFYRDKIKSIQNGNSDTDHIVLHRTIGDFIAGMTDSFALRQYEKMFGTSELKNY
jgi:dGTPase